MLVRELIFQMGFDSRTAERNAKRMDRVVGGLKRSLARVGVAAGAAMISLGAFALNAGDDFQEMSNRLKLVTTDLENLKEVQKGVFDVAQRSYGSLSATTDLYFGLAKAADKYGYSQERLLKVTETTAKLASMGGGDPASQAAALFQLRQGIMSGQLRGQELNSVLEQAPLVAEAIAKGIEGGSIENIRKMAEEGRLTGEQVLKSLEKAAGSTDAEFAKLDRTARMSRQMLRNAFTYYYGQMAQDGDMVKAQVEFYDELRNIITSSGFRSAIQGIMKGLVLIMRAFSKVFDLIGAVIDKLGGFENILKDVGIALAAFATIKIAGAIAGMIAWIKAVGVGTVVSYYFSTAVGTLSAAFSTLILPILAVIAVFAVLFLVFDDLWAWYNGQNSVIIPGLIAVWEGFANFFDNLIDGIVSGMRWMIDTFNSMMEPIMEAWNWLDGKMGELGKSKYNPKNWFGSDDEQITNDVISNSPRQQNNVFQPHVNISVPAGTNVEQAQYIKGEVLKSIHMENQRMMREAMNNFPEVE